MADNIEHRPLFRYGAVLHLGILLINVSLSGFLLYLSFTTQVQGIFVVYLIASILTFLPFPYFLYRLFSLLRAKYHISRDGLGIQWGLRTEDIPITNVEWVRLPADLVTDMEFPRFIMPGALLGNVNHRDLGRVEFIASSKKNLVYVATPEKVFALSPENRNAFLNDFYRSAELGSISPIDKQSTQPQFIVSSLFRDKVSRGILLASILISLILLVIVTFIIPTRSTVPLGLEAVGVNREESSAGRLILLPILSLFVFFIDFGYGSYLYRKRGFKNAAYLIFASSLILPLSFSILLVFVLFS
jgi:hypothetical protein